MNDYDRELKKWHNVPMKGFVFDIKPHKRNLFRNNKSAYVLQVFSRDQVKVMFADGSIGYIAKVNLIKESKRKRNQRLR